MSNDYHIAYLERLKQKQTDYSQPPPHEHIVGKDMDARPEDFKLFGKYGGAQTA